MLKEFKEFAVKGNVVDMAVGIIIGAAFGKIVDSLVKDLIMPPIGLLMGGINFGNYYLLLKEGAEVAGPYATLTAAKEAGATFSAHAVIVTATNGENWTAASDSAWLTLSAATAAWANAARGCCTA